jgi:hypothetical protein
MDTDQHLWIARIPPFPITQAMKAAFGNKRQKAITKRRRTHGHILPKGCMMGGSMTLSEY